MSTSNPTLFNQVYGPCVQSLKNLDELLTKAEKFADDKGKKHEDIINFRLIDDYRYERIGLAEQVQSCCNTFEWLFVRLGMMEDIKTEDDETTFAQFHQRIASTLDMMAKHGGKPEQWEGKDKEIVMMNTALGTFKFDDGQKYVSHFAIPNFHFHLSTAYCILRHLGVPIGAMDHLGKEIFVKVEE